MANKEPTMEEIRREALEYYNKGSTEDKARALNLFKLMDSDGDSSIDVAEFTSFIKGNRILSLMLTSEDLFSSIDKNGSGGLDFNEFITFFYVVFTSCSCDGCGGRLMGQQHVTCAECFDYGSESFNLCVTCFSSKNFAHQHDKFSDYAALMLKPVAPQKLESKVDPAAPKEQKSKVKPVGPKKPKSKVKPVAPKKSKSKVEPEAPKKPKSKVEPDVSVDQEIPVGDDDIAPDEIDGDDGGDDGGDEDDVCSFRKRDVAKFIAKEIVEAACTIM